ncbi:hypothetical protein HUB97_08245 [Halorubraceae archaeon YAN]|nr:hypothetical protein [Halorubraceae archaeon YAN]
MELDRVAPYFGAVACFVFAAVLSAPYLIVDSLVAPIGEYYAAGPLGIAGGVFLSVLGVVIFLSGERGRADSDLVAGIMVVVGVALFAMTTLWAVWIPDSVLFSFPQEYSWIEYHPWVSVALSFIIATIGAVYAWAVL